MKPESTARATLPPVRIHRLTAWRTPVGNRSHGSRCARSAHAQRAPARLEGGDLLADR